MSGRLTLDDCTLVAGAGLVALLLVGLTAALGHDAAASDIATTYSAGSSGAKALYLLLQSSHYSVGRWERPLSDLPPGDNTTLILADPEDNPTAADRKALARFVEKGGHVIATGVSGAFFLPAHPVAPDPIAGLTWKRVSSTAPSLATRAAPDITLAPRAYWDDEALALTLYSDDGKARVVKYTMGRGEVAWWASPTPATNAGLREPGNLDFVLASIGSVRRQILFDEYVHGYRRTISASLIASPFDWAAAQLALLAVAVLLTHSRRSGPIVPAAVEDRRSPLEFVRTLSALYQRAGAASIAVDIAYQQFRHRLTQRLGTTSAASAGDLQRAVHDRWHLDDRAFGDLIRACDAARDDPRLTVSAALELTRALWDYSRRLDLFRGSV